ncbi:DUF1697 domain-containing protein [Microbacterium sp. 18062]|uniref:DUF1697 domain-containing protein n=1 Tax=Microbacterium sp. 18062 TaxID=2681410 RepID=UPI001359AA6F|nr:DUF1697 domain-containing protein [Microbacterium sp. 18062]
MPTYLAFLRAINLGAKRVFPKDDIRRAVEAAGFEDVTTHLNTGNIRFGSRMRSRDRIERALEREFRSDRGFEVPAIVFEASEFAALAASARELSASRPGLSRHYVYLLKDELPAEVAARVEATSGPAGEMVVRDRAAHALLAPGYQHGTVDPLRAAKLLGVATSRNLNVVTGLAERWC